jgi:hypothetical protein
MATHDSVRVEFESTKGSAYSLDSQKRERQSGLIAAAAPTRFKRWLGSGGISRESVQAPTHADGQQ